mmetsp:Transcript_29815/g.95363  ORF Transcript_29815/g.95363 Transcript_29815/m.95363 type:complete len:255 (-) Transcript_29815:16-780(-)
MASATILQSALCRTSARFRPNPTLFHFPGLTSRPVYDAATIAALGREGGLDAEQWRHAFEFIGGLKAAHADIKAEYKRLVTAGVPSDYLVGDKEHALHEGDWQWHSYMQKGQVNKFFEMHCPATGAFLGELRKRQQLMAGVPVAYVFFSTLAAGASIQPHCAPANLRLRVHYPLVVPEGASVDDCGMRVADEKLQWVEGEPLIFDDSYEHEVWNKTDQERVVLLFDIWHPDIVYGEREAIRDMFDHAKMQGWLK